MQVVLTIIFYRIRALKRDQARFVGGKSAFLVGGARLFSFTFPAECTCGVLSYETQTLLIAKFKVFLLFQCLRDTPENNTDPEGADDVMSLLGMKIT